MPHINACNVIRVCCAINLFLEPSCFLERHRSCELWDYCRCVSKDDQFHNYFLGDWYFFGTQHQESKQNKSCAHVRRTLHYKRNLLAQQLFASFRVLRKKTNDIKQLKAEKRSIWIKFMTLLLQSWIFIRLSRGLLDLCSLFLSFLFNNDNFGYLYKFIFIMKLLKETSLVCQSLRQF